MVPSPPKIRITSASSEAAGIPMRQSMFASIWKGLRFFAEHPSPKITAARMCADEGIKNSSCGDSRPRLSGWAKPSGSRGSSGKSEDIHKRLLPYPRILSRFTHQPKPHGILQQTLDLHV